MSRRTVLPLDVLQLIAESFDTTELGSNLLLVNKDFYGVFLSHLYARPYDVCHHRLQRQATADAAWSDLFRTLRARPDLARLIVSWVAYTRAAIDQDESAIPPDATLSILSQVTNCTTFRLVVDAQQHNPIWKDPISTANVKHFRISARSTYPPSPIGLTTYQFNTWLERLPQLRSLTWDPLVTIVYFTLHKVAMPPTVTRLHIGRLDTPYFTEENLAACLSAAPQVNELRLTEYSASPPTLGRIPHLLQEVGIRLTRLQIDLSIGCMIGEAWEDDIGCLFALPLVELRITRIRHLSALVEELRTCGPCYTLQYLQLDTYASYGLDSCITAEQYVELGKTADLAKLADRTYLPSLKGLSGNGFKKELAKYGVLDAVEEKARQSGIVFYTTSSNDGEILVEDVPHPTTLINQLRVFNAPTCRSKFHSRCTP